MLRVTSKRESVAIQEAIIAPFAYMPYLCPLGELELVLSNWMLGPDPRYAQYYNQASQQGRTIILDNGIMEIGRAVEVGVLLDLARQLRPTLLTPPEVLNDAVQTVRLTQEFLSPFAASDLYPATQLLVVAHGNSFDLWRWCFEELIHLPMVGRIGVPYDLPFDLPGSTLHSEESPLEQLVRRRVGVCNWIAEHHPNIPLHLLGLAHPSELQLQARHPFIKSNDSSLATMAALHNIRYEEHDTGPFVKHFIDFQAPLDDNALDLAKHNIEVLKSYSQRHNRNNH